jgi:predicted glycoside hydrolase/deacetylase ChbG (UPF0249 family)
VKYLIVNADDFGYGAAINRGIVQCIDHGVVTSAGLMVNTPGTAEAVRMALERKDLSLGLHVNFTNEAQRLVEFSDPTICDGELRRQFGAFVDLVGRKPTHIDGHQHVHRFCPAIFRALADEHGVPLREQPPVTFKGGFYAQWQYGVSDPSKVSLDAISHILRDEVVDGIYELAVHPGFSDPAVPYVYDSDRELEMATLCDPRVPEIIREAGIRLINYHDLPEARAALGHV